MRVEELSESPTANRRQWRMPIIGRPYPPRWKIVRTGPQLADFRNDARKRTIRDDQHLVDAASKSIGPTAEVAGPGAASVLASREGMLDQRLCQRERRKLVKRGYKLICDFEMDRLPPGLQRYWFALTVLHPMGMVPAEGLSAHRFGRIRDFHQERRKRLGAGGLEIGWIDISMAVQPDGSILWCCHVHSVVGVVAPSRTLARRLLHKAYKVRKPRADAFHPVVAKDTFLGRDFTEPKKSLAGWLAYGSRSARMPLNLDRKSARGGSSSRPLKTIMYAAQIRPLIGPLSRVKPRDRFVLGGCRMGAKRLVRTEPPVRWRSVDPHRTTNGEVGIGGE